MLAVTDYINITIVENQDNLARIKHSYKCKRKN